jgi:hypothetical protein
LDISPLAVAVMEERGINHIRCQDFFQLAAGGPGPPEGRAGTYDTLLLMMNGIGLSGTLNGLRDFFNAAKILLRAGGQLIFDSTDIAYLYGGKPPKTPEYYGEVLYRYEYRRQLSDWFKWLFIDRKTLATIAGMEGWKTRIICEDDRDQYLVLCQVQ